MKLKATITSTLLVSFLCFGLGSASAQIDNIDDFIQAGVDDAETITKAYLKPLPSGLGGDINSGWVNSAETHQPLGFDLQIRGTLAFVPQSDENFDLSELDLNNTSPADPSETISPTIGGNDELGPEVVVENDGNEVARFDMPQGSGYPFVPAPMVQAGIGLVQDTDLIGRFVPQVSSGNITFDMMGFGLKHGLNQWLPSGGMLPVNISLVGGFTNINVTSDLDLDPEGIPRDPSDADTNFDNQEAKTSLNTFTIKALVGKDLPFISFYGGVGYQTATMEVNMNGNYPVNVSTPLGNRYDVVTDPFSYDADGDNKFSLLGGAKLKMAFFSIFGEFSIAKYPTANAGIEFSFR